MEFIGASTSLHSSKNIERKNAGDYAYASNHHGADYRRFYTAKPKGNQLAWLAITRRPVRGTMTPTLEVMEVLQEGKIGRSTPSQ